MALALTRAWPECELHVASRSAAPGELLAADFGGKLLHERTSTEPALVVNTTTWGETEESEAEPFPIDLDGLFVRLR